MPINRKPAAFRGPALLLTLTLAGGLTLSGCSDDSALDAPAPAPAPTPAPPPPAPTLAAPAGLMVAGAGATFLEFSWQRVEGASRYEIQLSLTAGDFGTVSVANVTGTMHRFTVEPETTAHARVRAVAAGVISDWSDAVSGTSTAAPIVLGVPRPRLSSTGPDHIEWTWAAVPDAQGYQVRVADSEDGLAEAPMTPTSNTTHRVPADPETTRYIQVRAAILRPSPATGDWSDAVEGTSDAAPTFLTVSMIPPDSGADSACRGQAFCPDEGTDAATAMATVNPKLMVTTSHPAEVSARFVGSASAFRLVEGENTPFAHATWSALQKEVAEDGVTFRFERLSAGAGQEPTAGAEVRYITCGPFRCSESSDRIPSAPEITIEDSAACTDFEAEFTLTAGAMRNGTPNQPNGLDLGWTYTSTGPATVTHVIASAGGLRVAAPAIVRNSYGRPLGSTRDDDRNINVFGGLLDPEVDTYKAFGVHDLEMTTDGPIRNGSADCFFESDSAVGARRWTGTSPGPPAFRPDAWKVDWGTYSLFRTAGTSSAVRRPEECFRIIVDDTSGCTTGHGGNCYGVTRADYLEGYSLEVQPQASVTWFDSQVNWPEGSDPFEGLDCAARTVNAAEQVEVCELFADEVDRYWGRGRVAIVGDRDAFGEGSQEWRLRPVIADNTYGTTRTLLALQVARNAPAPPGLRGEDDQTHHPRYIARPPGSRFSSLWLSDTTETPFASDDLDRLGVLGIDRTRNDRNLYYPSPRHAFQVWLPLKQFGLGIGSTGVGYRIGDEGGPVNRPVQRAIITFPILNDEHRTLHGDFGKLDFDDNGQADNFTSAFWANDRECDTGDGGEKKCDVEDVEFTGEVTFVMSRDSLQCAQTREISLTCDWDADGDDGKNRVFDAANADKFIACRPN